MLGSVFGGRWSDLALRRLTSANEGHYLPEACHPLLLLFRHTSLKALKPDACQMRLESTKPAMVFLPLSVVAYAWLAQERVHVASLCTALFFIGFFSM
jgi:hypothetical protein